MYSVNGWFRLVYTYDDEEPLDQERAVLAELEVYSSAIADGTNIEVRWTVANGSYLLTVTGAANRPRSHSAELHTLLGMVSERLPESWGMLYELDDERVEPPGRNAYRVTIMTHGVLQEQPDPFFSPVVPVIEPPEPEVG